jgi:hypothetical protein
VIRWSGLSLLFPPYVLNGTRFQLDAIPTVGFSDPILSYISVVRFFFDGVRMLNEGYQKVICFLLDTLPTPHIELMTPLPLDKTRSLQSRQFTEMDGAAYRVSTNR